MDEKRLFFGFEAHAPWPEAMPDAGTLKAKHRHLTLVFLGNTSYSEVRALLSKMPKPPFKIAPVGIADSLLCLPERHPRVVTWHVESFGKDPIGDYQEVLEGYFREAGYHIDKREFLKHITLGRMPFSEKEWKKVFAPLPLYLGPLHLYESAGKLHYEPIWTHHLLPPFKEIDHVADIAFEIHGEKIEDLFWNAQIALAFKAPEILPFLEREKRVETIEEIIMSLNAITTEADKEMGTPFKAVSFHGHVVKKKGVLSWEMIVDV
ncbi:MAG: hypothetical protein KDK60_04570 [Chlamydiia bacterium]|nr:hypothetical protein [Chlamydiia bacterium]